MELRAFRFRVCKVELERGQRSGDWDCSRKLWAWGRGLRLSGHRLKAQAVWIQIGLFFKPYNNIDMVSTTLDSLDSRISRI